MSKKINYGNVNMACPYCFYSGKQHGCEICKQKPEEESITQMVKRFFNLKQQ